MATQSDASGTIVEEDYDISGATKAEVYFQLSVTTTAQTLSQLGVTVPAWAAFAYLTPNVSGNAVVRYRCDGTAPTAAAGTPIPGWSAWPVQGLPSLQALEIIGTAGAVTVDLTIRG